MHISSFSLSSSSLASSIKAFRTSPQAAAPAAPGQSEASFTNSADSFANLVVQANQQPDVRSELVDSFKSRIAAGQYPTKDTIESLTDTIGHSILQLADSTQG